MPLQRAQPGRTFTALLLAIEQDRGLVGIAAVAATTRLPALFAFQMFGLFTLAAGALGARMVELALRGGGITGSALHVFVVAAAMAAQAGRRQLDDARHLP